jgi:hypothetical protein
MNPVVYTFFINRRQEDREQSFKYLDRSEADKQSALGPPSKRVCKYLVS